MTPHEDIVGALNRGELSLAYQPVVWMETGRPLGFEALLRWHHPTHGSITPSRMVPAAEETGAIVDIGRWVLREALRQTRQWREDVPGFDGLMIGVNISGRQLQDPGFTDVVRDTLTESGLEPDSVLLELTESVLMPDTQKTMAAVAGLRALGTRVAIDDFGTGYSSLSYLCDLPVTTIKVDRSFVGHLTTSHLRAPTIVRAVLDLARDLGLETIVEGVETPAQEGLLREMGATLGQGFRWAQPLTADEVPAWLGASTPG